MLIHEITKLQKIDEGLLSGVKDAITSVINSPTVQAIPGVQSIQSAQQRAAVARAQAHQAAQKLASKGYNVNTSTRPAAPLTIQQAAAQSKLKNSPLAHYISSIDTNAIQQLAKSFNPAVIQPKTTTRPDIAGGMTQAGKAAADAAAAAAGRQTIAKGMSRAGRDAAVKPTDAWGSSGANLLRQTGSKSYAYANDIATAGSSVPGVGAGYGYSYNNTQTAPAKRGRQRKK